MNLRPKILCLAGSFGKIVFAKISKKMTKIQICGPNGRNLFFFFELSRKIVKRLSKNGPVTGFWVQHAAFCINVQGSNRILSRVPKDLFFSFLFEKQVQRALIRVGEKVNLQDSTILKMFRLLEAKERKARKSTKSFKQTADFRPEKKRVCLFWS